MSMLRPLQRLPIVLHKLRINRYVRISVASISHNTIELTIALTRRTRAYPDTGESGETYDLEQEELLLGK